MKRSLGAFIAAIVFAGCTKVTSGPETGPGGGRHPWTKPGVLRIGVQSGPNTLNPILAANTTESMINRLMFDVLVSVDGAGKTQVPILAAEVPTLENGGISKDGLTITYKLRHNVRWHDDVPFTSKDIKFTYAAVVNKANNVISQSGYNLVKSVETPDDFTVVFHMKEPFSPVVNTILGESDNPYEVIPAHLLEQLPNVNNIPFNSQPIGTGPYKLKEWSRGDHLEFVSNDKYFLGKPKLDRIIIKIIPDENTELSQLKTHEIDWQFEASPQEYKELKTLTEIKSILQDKNNYERIQFNTKHPPLDDVRVRQAIAYAIDSQKLVDTLTFGSAQVADQDLPPFMWAHAQNLPRYTFDLAKAKSLMKDAGWAAGPGGYLQKDGRRLSLLLVYNTTNVTRRGAAVQVQSMLKDLGIDLQIKTYLGQQLFASIGMGGILQNGKFDLAWTGWVAGIDPDQSSLFMCNATPPNGNNETHYCNPQLDAAEKTALAKFDRPSRKAAYQTIEELLARDQPQITVWWPRQIQSINPDFKGFDPNPVTESWNAYQWEI